MEGSFAPSVSVAADSNVSPVDDREAAEILTMFALADEADAWPDERIGLVEGGAL